MKSALLLSLPLALALHCASAHAQYVWLNDKGIKQFSDMPPPPDVPKNRILKSPSGSASLPSASDDADKPGAQGNPPPSVADREADYRKRKAEEAEKAKKADEEAKRNAQNAANCERARAYAKSLDSGERISTTDKNGERSFLSDEQRSQEQRNVRDVLKDCK